ncbi:MAG: type II toxin-antitoxin system HicB family antitoxin [Candidatus Parcubacteria bacterium]|nr:type II toxin-antitoxin system HicB family antitoxin [Candidatus Parcubacteria bacterium]
MLNERKYTIETEQETDGRWIAEVLEIPGVLAYGDTIEHAQANVEALTLRVIADEIEENTSNNVFGFSNIAFSLS